VARKQPEKITPPGIQPGTMKPAQNPAAWKDGAPRQPANTSNPTREVTLHQPVSRPKSPESEKIHNPFTLNTL